MSTRVESPPSAGGMLGGRFVIAIVVALAIGAFAGSLVTRAIENDGAPASTAVYVGNGSKGIEGPRLAERFTELGSPVAWNAGKLEEMVSHQLAEQVRSEAMEDRQLAEDVHRHRPVGGPLG